MPRDTATIARSLPWFECGDGENVRRRFEAKYDLDPETGCLIWNKPACGGYGRLSIGNRPHLAHRVGYVLAFGEIPGGLDLDHLCRNRLCVNPLHLEPVTRGDNVRRGLDYRTAVAACSRGHAYDESNTFIDGRGHRDCRRCRVIRNRAYRSRLGAVQ